MGVEETGRLKQVALFSFVSRHVAGFSFILEFRVQYKRRECHFIFSVQNWNKTMSLLPQDASMNHALEKTLLIF